MLRLVDKRSKKEWEAHIKRIGEQTQINQFESSEDREIRIARAKRDYSYFVSYYLPTFATTTTPAFHAQAATMVSRTKQVALWLQWGRGLAKSVVADVAIPLWLWINEDIRFMLLIGQEQEKAELLLDDLRMQFEGNLRLINDFGIQKKIGYWGAGFFMTQNGFIAKSMGMGQEPRGLRVGGHRPDYIVCDDWETKETIKNPKRQDEYAKWLLTGIIPTMDGDTQRIILAQNNFAPRMIFSKIVNENKGWKIRRQNAFDPATLAPVWKDKYSADYYARRIEVMGTLEANAEYNNEPHIEGKIFTEDMIQWCKLPRLDTFKAIVGTWDVAFAGSRTSDFNAVRVWGVKDNKKYLIDCFVKRSKIKPALDWIAQYQINLPASVSVPFRFEAQFWNDEIYRIIEEVAAQYSITLNLVKSEKPKKKKYDRMLEMHPQYQNGRIFYNQKLKDHNDTKEGLAQLKGLEPGYRSHDDAPDADKEAFDYLDRYARAFHHTYRVETLASRKY